MFVLLGRDVRPRRGNVCRIIGTNSSIADTHTKMIEWVNFEELSLSNSTCWRTNFIDECVRRKCLFDIVIAMKTFQNQLTQLTIMCWNYAHERFAQERIINGITSVNAYNTFALPKLFSFSFVRSGHSYAGRNASRQLIAKLGSEYRPLIQVTAYFAMYDRGNSIFWTT